MGRKIKRMSMTKFLAMGTERNNNPACEEPEGTVTSLGFNKIRVVLPNNKAWFANFRKANDEVKMTYFNCNQVATKQDLTELFRIAHAHWKIPFTARIEPIKHSRNLYVGTVLGPEHMRNTFLHELNSRNIELLENWDKEEQYFIIGKQLENINWDRLIPYWNKARLFTPEGFLNYLNGNVDNNKNDADVNRILSKCQYFSEGYFKWPHTDIYPSKGILTDIDAPEDGILSFCGYHVGRTGIPEYNRHQILRMVFSGKLPFVGNMEYMQEWNTAQTPYRLQKLANTIAALAQNAKRRRNRNMEYAISDWESDLAWLKKEYYDKMNFRFPWPNTNVW